MEIVRSADYHIDREYYKIVPRFFWSSHTKVRTDRLKNWKQWDIVCEEMPDKILVNGKHYNLTEVNNEKTKT